MKIALCGAGGTGKGSLIRAFRNSREFPDYIQINSPNERIAKTMFPYLEKYSALDSGDKKAYQYAILSALMTLEWNFDEDNTIQERSVFDYIPYAIANDPDSRWSEDYTQMIVKYVKKHHPYNLLVYVPVEFDPSNDDAPFKERDYNKCKKTDCILRFALAACKPMLRAEGIKMITVSGTVEERLAQLTEAVKNYDRD